MKAINVMIISLFPFLFGCIRQPINSAEKDKAVQEYIVSENQPIEKIKIWGAFDVKITQGAENRVIFKMTPDDFKNVKCVLQNGEFEISRNDRMHSFPNRVYKVFIEVQSIKDLDFEGACDVSISDFTASKAVKIDLSGASQIKMSKFISSYPLEVDVSGASNVEVGELEVTDFEIDLSGASSAKIMKIKTNVIKAEASGASFLEIVGATNQFEADASGASKINAKNLDIANVRNLNSSGASSIKLKNK